MGLLGRIAGGIGTGGLSEAGKGFAKGISKMRENQKPEKQYWGGDKKEYEQQQRFMENEQEQARANAEASVKRSGGAADVATKDYGRLGGQVEDYGNVQGREAGQADAGFDRSMSDYKGSRSATSEDAAMIERDARGLDKTYQTTADRQFNLNQGRAGNAAQATAAAGGPAAMRAAIASQTSSGADASAQAEITRAQETNELAKMKQSAYATAAGIRSGIGAQDQSAGQIYAGRQQNAYQNQANSFGQRGEIVGASNAAQQGAAELGANTAVTQQGNIMGTRTAMETAQLNADREREAQRQEGKRTQFNRVRDPLGMGGG